MNEFQRALVALDLSALDQQILRYFVNFAGWVSLEKSYFVHIIRDFSMPQNLDVEFHKLFATEYPVDEKIRDKLLLDVQDAMGEREEPEISIEVIEGAPYEKLMHWTKIKEIDLLVVGQKAVSEGSGIVARRVARKAPCHVLFVPEQGRTEVRRILAPVDFSAPSRRALSIALQLGRTLPDAAVSSLYVVDMPPGDYYIQPYQDIRLRAALMDSARSAYDNFLRSSGIDPRGIDALFTENTYSNVANHIADYAENNEVDLIVIGAQGHSAFENFVYGSVTESLVERCKNVPILIIR